MKFRETGFLAVLAVVAAGLLGSVTTACDLNVEPVGVVSDSAQQDDSQGTTR